MEASDQSVQRSSHLDIYGNLRKAKHVAKKTNPFHIRSRRKQRDSLPIASSATDLTNDGNHYEREIEMNENGMQPTGLPLVSITDERQEPAEGVTSTDSQPRVTFDKTSGGLTSEQSSRVPTRGRGDSRSEMSYNPMPALGVSESRDEERGLNAPRSNEEKPPKHFTAGGQIKFILFSSWINILLFAVPVGIALHCVKANSIAVFVVNFLAIIPLAAMLSNATEEIALRTGETFGGLLNATFGNAVELIVSLIALFKNEFLIVQTSLIGSMLSNLLLVMGMCFFFGGLSRIEQNFNVTVAQTASSMLSLAVGSLIIPTAFHEWSGAGKLGIAPLSRGTSVLLLIVYGCYLFFQLKTHINMYNQRSPKAEKLKWSKVDDGDVRRILAQAGAAATAQGIRDGAKISDKPQASEDGDDDEEEPQLQWWVAIIALLISTVFVAVCAEFMVDSIDDLTKTGGVSETFVGLILLPIVGNAAEHVTAVTVAMKDKMDLAIGVAVGSSMQIALLVLPLIVVIGWIAGKDDMTLYFDGFQIAVLFVSMLLVNYLIQDGKSHWLEGVMLMVLYLIICISAWFYPSSGEKSA